MFSPVLATCGSNAIRELCRNSVDCIFYISEKPLISQQHSDLLIVIRIAENNTAPRSTSLPSPKITSISIPQSTQISYARATHRECHAPRAGVELRRTPTHRRNDGLSRDSSALRPPKPLLSRGCGGRSADTHININRCVPDGPTLIWRNLEAQPTPQRVGPVFPPLPTTRVDPERFITRYCGYNLTTGT